MFRRHSENKAKLEHKLYLAREAPEPIFDLSDCRLKHVPQGIYSLCRVFLKEVLKLDRNCLGSLTGGGTLKDLHQLHVIDLRQNAFVTITDDIQFMRNLRELYLNDNQLKRLPDSICTLSNLLIFNLANNQLKGLPENFGDLKRLKLLTLTGNKQLKYLPKTMCKNQNLTGLEVDAQNFVYPPENVMRRGAALIIRYICNDVGITYIGPTAPDSPPKQYEESEDHIDAFEAKIWKLEAVKKQRLQDFLEMEKANELMQKQELEAANSRKMDTMKLLSDITKEQNKFDLKLMKLREEREVDQFRLIEQVLQVEENADNAIRQLLALSNEPLLQLLEHEKDEEQRLIAAANRYSSTLKKEAILDDMKALLQHELQRFQQHDLTRLDLSKNVLRQELEQDDLVTKVLQNQDLQKAELVSTLQEDSELQKVAVGALLERGDARSWGLVQQVRLVEGQLAALTQIEMNKRQLKIDENLNDLAEKRVNLSILLMELLEKQNERRGQLLATLQTMQDNCTESDDFWLKQYQRLLEKLPEGLSEAQKNIDPALAQALLANGVLIYLPFLAKLIQAQCDVGNIIDADLAEAGITNPQERSRILETFQSYSMGHVVPTAPVLEAPSTSASAPSETSSHAECVICMDKPCEVIYVPCGHFCSCLECQTELVNCPMCRARIERKIRVISS